MQVFMDYLLQILATVLVAVLGVLATMAWRKFSTWMATKVGAAEWEAIVKQITVGVQAAEQIYSAGTGTEKKAYVQNYLESLGLTVNDAVIEAIVNELYGGKKTGAAQDATSAPEMAQIDARSGGVDMDTDPDATTV